MWEDVAPSTQLYRGAHLSWLRTLDAPDTFDRDPLVQAFSVCRYHSRFCASQHLDQVMARIAITQEDAELGGSCVDSITRRIQSLTDVPVPPEMFLQVHLYDLFAFIHANQDEVHARVLVYIVATNQFCCLTPRTGTSDRPLLILAVFCDHIFEADLGRLTEYRNSLSNSRPVVSLPDINL